MASTTPPSGRPSHQTALVVLLEENAPESLYSAVQDIRRVGDRHYNRWPPHITIAYPFAPHEELDTAANVLHAGLQGVRPFELLFERFGFFKHGASSHTIWLAPGEPDVEAGGAGGTEDGPPPPHPELIRLQAAVEAVLPTYNEVRARHGHFTPHLSLKQAPWPRQVQSFIKKDKWTPRRYPVSEVVILTRGPDTPFTPAYRIPLGGAGPVVRVEQPPPPPPPPTAHQRKGAPSETGKGKVVDHSGGGAQEGGEKVESDIRVEEAFDVDGSIMEGGGQILRVSIALATLLNQPVRISKIRAKRSRRGLQPQHLAGVQLVSRLGQADLVGGRVGSTEIVMKPRSIRGGEHTADPGTAGSITLLIQAALPLLPFASTTNEGQGAVPEAVRLTLRGGTTVSHSPSIDYFLLITVPLLQRMGIRIDTHVKYRGYYPLGGGQVEIAVDPVDCIKPIEMLDCGVPISVRAVVCGIVDEGGQTHTLADAMEEAVRAAIHERWGDGVEVVEVARHIEVQQQEPQHHKDDNRRGGGSGNDKKRARLRKRKREAFQVLLVLETSTGCLLGADELVEDLRASSLPSPQGIATALVDKLAACIDAGSCVDEHTVDQLVVFMALAQGTSRILGPPKSLITSAHLDTAVHMAESLSGAKLEVAEGREGGPMEVRCEGIGFRRK